MIVFDDIKSLGDYLPEIPPSQEYLTLNFSPDFKPRNHRWQNYGLSADFLGDYFAAFFPGEEVFNSKINLKDTVKAAVSYIANELLENAVKYSATSTHFPISITLYLYQQQIIFQVINYTETSNAFKYHTFVETLLKSNLEELYISQLEKTAAEGIGESQLGLLTMMNDYLVSLGWQFAPVNDTSDIIKITVIARMNCELN